MRDVQLLTECYCDTNFIETLVPPASGYNHQKGCGTIAARMQDNLNDTMALGIIDNDKKEIDYLKYFNLVKDFGDFEIQKHKEKEHYFILIKPALEKFILNISDTLKLDLKLYKLPEDFQDFKKLSKRQTSKFDQRFKSLFFEFINREEPLTLKLKEVLEFFILNDYEVDIEQLKKM